jgi:predicted ribosomally synthesized peptide with nif11-like leader
MIEEYCHQKPMTEDQIQAFIAAFQSNTSLQERLKSAADSEAIVAIAKEAGFAISKEDVDKYRGQQTKELSDSDLEAVAGGGSCVPSTDTEASSGCPTAGTTDLCY